MSMQKSFLKLTCCFVLLSVLSIASCKHGADDEPAINGRVLSGMTGSPVSGSVVTLKQGGSAIASVTTGADGSYTFADIGAGDYTVSASASGFVQAETASFACSGAISGKDMMLNRDFQSVTAAIVAGTQGTDGIDDTHLYLPFGVAAGPDGTIYISDGSHLIRKIEPGSQVISEVAGIAGSDDFNDGVAEEAKFHYPSGLAVGPDNEIYVADYMNNRIRKILNDEVSTVAGTGGDGGFSGDGGPALEAELYRPADVAVDSAGNIYIADTWHYRVRKVSAETGYISTIAGGGDKQNADNIQATEAQLTYIWGIAVDAEGIVYVSEGNRVRRIAADGIITTVAGGSTGINLNSPNGIAVDAAGTLYIVDNTNHNIVMVRNGIGEVIVSSGLSYPRMITIGPDGSLYVANYYRQVILRY